MEVLKEKDKKKLKSIFKGIEKDVTIIMFTQEQECQHCEMVRTMLEELSDLSDKLTLQVHDFVVETDLAKQCGVDKVPAIVLVGDKDYGIHFYGVPAGYELGVLIEDILDVGKRNPGLGEDVMDELAKIDRPVHLQVLTSPT